MTKEEALKKIEELKDFINKENLRPTKEQRFYDLANNLTQRFDKDKYPDSIFYFKDDKYFFEIEKSNMWCSYLNIWSVFEKEYGMNYNEIQSFIKIKVEEHFKRKGLTPESHISVGIDKVEEHFKRKGLTPVYF